MTTDPTITNVRVITWPADEWGVAIDYSDQHRTAYCVGTRAEAEAELVRLETDPQFALRIRRIMGK